MANSKSTSDDKGARSKTGKKAESNAPKAAAAAAATAPARGTKATAPAAAAAAPAKKAEPKAKIMVTSEERNRMIQEAAYYIAEKHGFGGDSQQDWLDATAQIDNMIMSKNKTSGA